MKWLLLPLLLVSCASARTEGAALRLQFENGLCSGTAVGRNLVLTAAHCWQAGRLVAINGRPAFALEKIEDGEDHALIRVTADLKAHVTRMAKPKAGEDVRWVGNPAGLDRAHRKGIVATVIDGEALLQAPAFGGDSGAGVFNDRGELVAVVSGAKWWTHRDIVFALTYCKPLKFTAKDWREIRE